MTIEGLEGQCLICGATDDLTVEHIIPQTLWNRFGLDPNSNDLARYRTVLCDRHNRATSGLHNRPAMMQLIADTGADGDGGQVTKQALLQLADWSIWVMMLMGLARGSGVLPRQQALDHLQRRFDGSSAGGPPPGIRVYAARIDQYVSNPDGAEASHMVALTGDPQVLLDVNRRPSGFRTSAGPIGAAESIGLGRVALLVLGPTHSSGPDHNTRLDQVAARAGLGRIHPLPSPLPTLEPRVIDMREVSQLFTRPPFGADTSLLPSNIRRLLSAMAANR